MSPKVSITFWEVQKMFIVYPAVDKEEWYIIYPDVPSSGDWENVFWGHDLTESKLSRYPLSSIIIVVKYLAEARSFLT